MTRIILTVGCVGKTYASNNYKNIYDWDQHTMDYKYDKTGFEHLSNEEFKGIPNRKIKDGWFERYMKDWCDLIDKDEYDIVTGWLQHDCLNYLLNKGYNVEIILVQCNKNNENVYKQRAINRGNSNIFWNNLRESYDKTLLEYTTDNQIKTYVLQEPIFFDEFLLSTGTKLIPK